MTSRREIDIVERIAKAIWETQDGSKRLPWTEMSQYDREYYIVYARAASALLADEIDTLRQRVKELEEALDLAMGGGNHLANVLVKNLGATFPERTPYDMAPDDALRIICATDNYDVWCCWSALMRARALSGAKT